MNKILKIAIAVVLCAIVILVVTLVACQTEKPEPDQSTTTTTTTTSSSTTTKKEPDDTTTTTTTGKEEPDPDPDPVGDFTECDDTVYVISDELNIRKDPSFPEDNSNIYTSAKEGEALNRIGYNETWTKVKLDGETYYVSSKYVSETKPVVDFTTVDEVVYYAGPYDSIAVREKPNLESDKVATIAYGTSLKRIGVAKEDFHGEDEDGPFTIRFARVVVTLTNEDGTKSDVTGYINNKHLSTTKPADKPATNPADPDNGITFAASTDKLEVKENVDSYNLRKSADASASAATTIKTGDKITVTHKGTDSKGTVWYKVTFNGESYYIIYNDKYLTLN